LVSDGFELHKGVRRQAIAHGVRGRARANAKNQKSLA
jgi:hypothetical protein